MIIRLQTHHSTVTSAGVKTSSIVAHAFVRTHFIRMDGHGFKLKRDEQKYFRIMITFAVFNLVCDALISLRIRIYCQQFIVIRKVVRRFLFSFQIMIISNLTCTTGTALILLSTYTINRISGKLCVVVPPKAFDKSQSTTKSGRRFSDINLIKVFICQWIAVLQQTY